MELEEEDSEESLADPVHDKTHTENSSSYCGTPTPLESSDPIEVLREGKNVDFRKALAPTPEGETVEE